MPTPLLRLPTWADGASDIVDPGVGKQAIGWIEDEQPPAQFFNWWKNNVGQWVAFLDSIKDMQHFSLRPNAQVKALTYADLKDIAHHVNGNEHDAPMLMAVGGAGTTVLKSHQGNVWESIGATSNTGPRSVAADQDVATAVTWVIVGTTQQISSSTDGGDTWTSRTSAIVAGTLDKVRFGGGLFVCVGNISQIQTSPDGITWTLRTNPGGTGLSDIFYDSIGGLWVIVGGNTVLTSPDGMTWVDRSGFYGGASNINNVTFDDLNGLWVLGGGEVWTTTDPTAVSWIDRSGAFGLSGSQVVTGLAYNSDGTVMAIRDGGTLADEVDGIGISHDGGVTWRVEDFDFGEPGGGLENAIYANGQWFIVGRDDGVDGLILQSLKV